jgi:hypothetical protein
VERFPTARIAFFNQAHVVNNRPLMSADHTQNADNRSTYLQRHSEHLNLFKKSDSMPVYSLTWDTKYGQWLCFNYKMLGAPDAVWCNPPGGAV